MERWSILNEFRINVLPICSKRGKKFPTLILSQFFEIGDFQSGNLLGWSFGTLTNFVHQDGLFTQVYEHGDTGYPCSTGRFTTVEIYCGGCPAGTTCWNETNLAYCICNSTYDMQFNPCRYFLFIILYLPISLVLKVGMSHCPQGILPPGPPLPIHTPSNGMTGGAVFGIVLLVYVFFIYNLNNI